MTDVHDRQTRSRNMAAIRNSNTKPELRVRHELHRRGLRYSLKNKSLPGKPDVLLSKYRVAVFIHGCFWHRHHCNYFKLPKTNTEFWNNKISENVKRDTEVITQITDIGYRVLVIWECIFKGKNKERLDSLFENIILWIKSEDKESEILIIPD
jgi:DNA mismatch endonuclease (patch repair protein)